MTATISHIGYVPRLPVVDCGEGIAVAGIDFDQAVWPEITMGDVCRSYIHEHCRPAGVDPKRAAQALRDWIEALDPMTDPRTLTRADGRKVVDHILARGCSPGSARRIMTVGNAALNHAKKEERILKVPKFQMPDSASPRQRVITEDEKRRLMQLPKPRRLQLFLLLAFATGARSRAIEELTWDRVDFANRIIDFRVPGVKYKNKRRAVVPIADALLPRLLSAYERRTDEYVIGLGPRGRLSTTYHGIKDCLRQIGINERGVARHVARHTVATRMLEARTEIYEVAMVLGDTVGMIERTYSHIKPAALMGAVNRL